MTRDWSGTASEANTAPPAIMSFFVWLEAESNRHIRRAFISRVALPLSYRAAVVYFTVLHSLFFFNYSTGRRVLHSFQLSANTFVTLF